MAELAPDWISPEEYLRRERLSETKNEYLNGVIYPLGMPPKGPPGVRRRRSTLTLNLAILLREALRKGSYQVFTSAVGLGQGGEAKRVGFDLVIADEPMFGGEDENDLLNPLVLVVVTSASDNRRLSLFEYEVVETLQEVWCVEADRRQIARNRRLGPGRWLIEFYSGGEVPVADRGMSISIDRMYEGITLSDDPPLR